MIRDLRGEFWDNVKVGGTSTEFNQNLENTILEIGSDTVNTHSIKFKIVLMIVSCLLVGTVVMLGVLRLSYKKNMEAIALQTLHASQQSLGNLEQNDVMKLSSTLQVLLQDPEFKKVFMQRDREALYDRAKPLFEKLEAEFSITHWYFIEPEPDKTCFLRVHNKSKYGDEITRYTYENAVSTKRFASGKELGKTAFALRVVHPYFDNGELIGYMELGEEIDHFFEIMKQQTQNEYGLLIDKQFLDEDKWKSVREAKGESNNWNDMADTLLVFNTTRDESLLAYGGKIADVSDDGVVLEQLTQGDAVFIRGIFPLYDAGNRKVGGVFVLQDVTEIHSEMEVTQRKIVATILVLMLLLSAAIILMLDRMIIVRLSSMIDVATRVVGGDYETKIACSSKDEIGQFEMLFEQFRGVFVSTLKELEKANKK